MVNALNYNWRVLTKYKTNAGDGFFVYFRLYGPTEPYFEKSWPLSNVEKID